MNISELKATPKGTALRYRDEIVTLLGTYSEEVTPGRYVTRAYVRDADNRESYILAKTLRLADEVAHAISTLTPAMIKALKKSFADGTVAANRNIERALIRRGLATEVRGTVTRRNRYSDYAQTVYDAYLGARLTDEGRKVRAALLKGE